MVCDQYMWPQEFKDERRDKPNCILSPQTSSSRDSFTGRFYSEDVKTVNNSGEQVMIR